MIRSRFYRNIPKLLIDSPPFHFIRTMYVPAAKPYVETIRSCTRPQSSNWTSDFKIR